MEKQRISNNRSVIKPANEARFFGKIVRQIAWSVNEVVQ